MKIKFTKMTGAGNDFIILEKKDMLSPLKSSDVQFLCDRKYGIGADGVIVITTDGNKAFAADFFNADGGGGMLCGNGARCILLYAAKNYIIDFESTVDFFFAGIPCAGIVHNCRDVEFFLKPEVSILPVASLELGDLQLSGYFVDVGSRHFVMDISTLHDCIPFHSLKDFPVSQFGPKIRYHKRFQPEGVNVNFCELIDKELFVRTWERGVENETLACGTGSTASALVFSMLNKVEPPVAVRAYSGDNLFINFDSFCVPSFLTLRGPAIDIFQGHIALEEHTPREAVS